MAIYLIRHGETASNAARIVQTPDIPLSDRGSAQAERLAKRLATAGITDIVSSDLRRAVLTAEIVQRATAAQLHFDAGLQERNYGDIRGRAYAEFDVDILSPEYEPPGGETWSQFHARVDLLWPRIVNAARRATGSLAVITHGLVCHSLVTRHLTLGDQPPPLRWANTSVTIIDVEPPWQVRVLNSTTHLKGGTTDDRGTLSGL
ncbi:MAG: histidine phosphatase family protein [Deltaproteobacteria bacterium]|nr:histidine phosphatase family protein [Deltaproteobacteria bacterium]